MLPIAVLCVVGVGCGGASPGNPTSQLRSTLRYEQSGGLTGRTYRLTVAPDGRAQLASRGKPTVRFRVGSQARSQLARKLGEARVAGRTRDFAPATPVADGIGETVRYAGGEVRTASGADAPRAVESLMATLAELVRRRNP